MVSIKFFSTLLNTITPVINTRQVATTEYSIAPTSNEPDDNKTYLNASTIEVTGFNFNKKTNLSLLTEDNG